MRISWSREKDTRKQLEARYDAFCRTLGIGNEQIKAMQKIGLTILMDLYSDGFDRGYDVGYSVATDEHYDEHYKEQEDYQ